LHYFRGVATHQKGYETSNNNATDTQTGDLAAFTTAVFHIGTLSSSREIHKDKELR
jgi:hypothetical protein